MLILIKILQIDKYNFNIGKYLFYITETFLQRLASFSTTFAINLGKNHNQYL
jgi:hypothetical protein